MPAPAKVKTWQFNVNSVQYGSTFDNTSKSVVFQIKTALKGFTTQPWTVVGSSNGSTSNMTGTDTWTTSANLVWAAPGTAHSWIVLKQTGMSSQYSVCLDLNSTSTYNMGVVVSPSSGFSGGSTTARPTAGDEVPFYNGTQTSYLWEGNTTGNLPVVVHCMQSTDGKCTRVVLCRQGSANALWVFDTALNPQSNWNGPKVFFGFMAGSGNTPTVANINNSPTYWSFRHGLTNGSFYLAALGAASNVLISSSAGNIPNGVSGEYPFTPLTLWSDTAPMRGIFGTVCDMYLGGNSTLNTAAFNDASSNKYAWAQFGNIILPWTSLSSPGYS